MKDIIKFKIINTPYPRQDINWFCTNMHCQNIIKNICKMHNNVNKNNKSDILQLTAYRNIKQYLYKIGFKFSTKQFNNSIKKRKDNKFNLIGNKSNKRKRISQETIIVIDNYLKSNSRYSHTGQKNILEIPKVSIFKKLKIENPLIKLSYSSFCKYSPKHYKKGKKRTDMCGLCLFGEMAKKVNIESLSNEKKQEYQEKIEAYENHLISKKKQKQFYDKQLTNIEENACLLHIDFKENFKIGHKGDETGEDFYNKRQMTCLGLGLIYKDQNINKIEYANFFSEILTHDSLFVIENLEKTFIDLKRKFKTINLWSDCGPHFRSTELMNYFKEASKKHNININMNFFGEYHGKSIVDGNFGKLNSIFTQINQKYEIKTATDLKEAFKSEYEKRKIENVYFHVYERENRPKYRYKLIIQKFKDNLFYSFFNGKIYSSVYSTLHPRNKDYVICKSKKEKDIKVDRKTPEYLNTTSRFAPYFSYRTMQKLKRRILTQT